MRGKNEKKKNKKELSKVKTENQDEAQRGKR